MKFTRNSRFFLFLRKVAKEFITEFTDYIKSTFAINITISPTQPNILYLKEGLIVVHLISFLDIKCNKIIIEPFKTEKSTYIRIYEDQWKSKEELIKSRISSILGENQRIYARKCILKRVDKSTCDEFLEANHLLGTCNSGFRLGLYVGLNLVAIAAFSKSRIMVDSDVYYRSYELIRFASLRNYTVVGGLNKLLTGFITEKNAKHIMTYIDLEWGEGKSFKSLGFKEMGKTEGQIFIINPINHQRSKYIEGIEKEERGYIVKNLGSQKLILNLREV